MHERDERGILTSPPVARGDAEGKRVAMGRAGHVSAARARFSRLARTNRRIATWISVLRRRRRAPQHPQDAAFAPGHRIQVEGGSQRKEADGRCLATELDT
jgi:ribosomal protein L39E